jgi:hypothetical protein
LKAKWELRFHNARLFAAALLAIAFFLPVSSCTEITLGKDVSVHETEEIEKADKLLHRVYTYPYKRVAIDDAMSWSILAAFFWPLAALKFREKAPNLSGLSLNTIELLLCLMTGWIMVDFTMLARLEYGGYIAYGGIFIYATTSLADTVILTWKRARGAMRERRSKALHQ